MLQSLMEEGWYVYSFWNPKTSLIRSIDTIVSQHSATNFVNVSTWPLVYNYLEKSGPAGIEVIAKHIPQQKADLFWYAFGLSQNFPMNTKDYWLNRSKKEEFAAYFSVCEQETKLIENAVINYLEHGVVKATEYGISLAPFNFLEPTSSTKYYDGTDLGYDYWRKIIPAHWNSKIDEAFASFHKPVPTGPQAPVPFYHRWLSDRAIDDTLRLALDYKNYHAFSQLIEAMIFDQMNTKISDIPAETRVCDYPIRDYSLDAKPTLWKFLVKHFMENKDPKFLQIVAQYIDCKRAEVSSLVHASSIKFHTP